MPKRDLGKVFVTGADGFIGSHLTERLINEGFEVTALCIYNSIGGYGWLEPIADKQPNNLKLLLGDVRDAGFLERSIANHDTVFHLASLIAIPYSYLAPQSYFDTNVNGAMNVANACLKAEVGRLIHTSTSEVYGTAQFVPITESHPIQGQSPYSASKISADVLIESFCRSFQLPAVTLRPFNTYGPRQSLRAVIPTTIVQVLQGVREIRLGAISPTRDFNYIDDTVAAFMAVAEAGNDVLGNVYNTGSGREITIENMVNLVAKIIGQDIKIQCDEARLRPANSEVDRLLCSSAKLTSVTGWKPAVSLEEGLNRTIEWMRTQVKSKRATIYHR
ncbi:MAG: GDP-mannose 4,6-dehydratase [Proteobacteria bacterium]|nr:GDP-mannose 4,6-dehydratase [Pseudomonadota bacterium]